MPEMDGLTATRTIRQEARFNHLPIIAMTAHAMEGDRQRSLDAGMQDHLTKPIHLEALYAALLRWIARAPTQARAPRHTAAFQALPPPSRRCQASTPPPAWPTAWAGPILYLRILDNFVRRIRR